MIETNKIIEKEVSRKAFLYEIQLDVDDKYFINEIDKSLEKLNLYYTTNVRGKMTHWRAFCKDEKFFDVLTRGFDYMTQFTNIDRAALEDAWGLKIEKGDYTKRHNHGTSVLSGILYLNDVDQELVFPDLSINVKPKKGSLLIFSPWLDHMTGLNQSEKAKYAIAFNFKEIKDKNWG